MAYIPTTWANGDVITAAGLNHIEQGVAAAGDTVVLHVDQETWALDKTWQEIYNALASGKICIIVLPSQDGAIKLAFIVTVYPTTYEGVEYYAANGAIDYGDGTMTVVNGFALTTSPDGYPIVDY